MVVFIKVLGQTMENTFMDTKISTQKSTEVAVYARVSTDTQELEHQIAQCKRFAEYKQFKINAVYKDICSGNELKNIPDFSKLVLDLRAGKHDGLIIFRFDRLFRNTVEAVNIFQELDNKGIKVYSISENLDTSTAIGQAMRSMILVLAQLERENISEATKRRLESLKDSGKKLGRPSLSLYQVEKIIFLRGEKKSYSQIASVMNIKKSTVAKYCRQLLGGL